MSGMHGGTCLLYSNIFIFYFLIFFRAPAARAGNPKITLSSAIRYRALINLSSAIRYLAQITFVSAIRYNIYKNINILFYVFKNF